MQKSHYCHVLTVMLGLCVINIDNCMMLVLFVQNWN